VDRLDAGQSVAGAVETLSPQARLEEALFTGLRLNEGIDEAGFGQRFGIDPWARYGSELDPFVQSQRMWRNGGRFGLTREGMLVANEILSVFV
jgi:oxygen-independent coproporphyrinogen-3 oxidase